MLNNTFSSIKSGIEQVMIMDDDDEWWWWLWLWWLWYGCDDVSWSLLGVSRSRLTAYLSTSLKLRTYLNSSTQILRYYRPQKLNKIHDNVIKGFPALMFILSVFRYEQKWRHCDIQFWKESAKSRRASGTSRTRSLFPCVYLLWLWIVMLDWKEGYYRVYIGFLLLNHMAF